MDYRRLPLEFCLPEVRAEFRKKLITAHVELLKVYSDNEHAFTLRANDFTGAFMKDFLILTVDALLFKPPSYFEALSEKYGLYFKAAYNLRVTSILDAHAYGEDVFDLLRGRFGSLFTNHVNAFKLYLARQEAWDKYWSKEFSQEAKKD